MVRSSLNWVSSRSLLQSSLVGFLLLMTANATSAVSPSNFHSTSAHYDAGGPGSWFNIVGHSVKGEYLIINYTIEYPGMTKVKLFDDSKQLLWRSQYVNDTEGEHRLILRRASLTGGNYQFEFDYKNHVETYNISI